ncbi:MULTISPECIES: hypothetical protein [unclassified Chryseobacterium]|uniref:hypothetical protein n=1 Tax=unclassified Chryseobacterium TaxID=2593645 RepID=UPI0009558D85|nr:MULTISPECIES: hypothetical protein [unclassified Chryseobacterium]SIQ53227.1 hypothetical protein SAMN05880573_106142 [Chryseobacterium sp. RU33C]
MNPELKNIDTNLLLGKSKKDIQDELGFQFNHFPAKEWTYYLCTNWLGFKEFLVIYFENEKVKKVEKKLHFFGKT